MLVDVGKLLDLLEEVGRALFLVGESPDPVSRQSYEELYLKVEDMKERLLQEVS